MPRRRCSIRFSCRPAGAGRRCGAGAAHLARADHGTGGDGGGDQPGRADRDSLDHLYRAFNLARQFASLDHISSGRTAWNIVTSWLATAAENYGGAGQVSHAERYARGEEFMEVVKALWDSWAADAVLDDRAAGRYARPDRIRSISHRGNFYTVAGPLNMPRCPQGRPVFVQAGSSDTGRRFAARHAEAVFTAHMAKATAQEFYADLKTVAAAGTAARPSADPARPQPDDRRDRSRGAAPGARGQRTHRSGGRAQAAVGPLRRV